jgi:hypothetical protein
LTFVCIYLHFCVVFWFHHNQYRAIACHDSGFGFTQQRSNHFFAKGLAYGISVPTTVNISPSGCIRLHSNTIWHYSEYVVCHIGEICVLWVHCLLLASPVGYVQDSKKAAKVHWAGAIIIVIWIGVPSGALVLQAVNWNRAWWRSICVPCNLFIWVLFQSDC